MQGSKMAIYEADGVAIQKPHRASSHCGRVLIQFDLPNGLEELRRCDCSLCRRRGAIAASVPLAGIKIIQKIQKIKGVAVVDLSSRPLSQAISLYLTIGAFLSLADIKNLRNRLSQQ